MRVVFSIECRVSPPPQPMDLSVGVWSVSDYVCVKTDTSVVKVYHLGIRE